MIFNPLADPCLPCGLWRGVKSPCIRPKVVSKGLIAFVGEGPGEKEDEQNEPFVGRAGQVLRSILATLGLVAWHDYTLLNAVACRPPGNRPPKSREINLCREFLVDDLKRLSPRLVIALGASAARALQLPERPLKELRNQEYDLVGLLGTNVPCYVTYHPAASFRPGKINLQHELAEDLARYLGVRKSDIDKPAESCHTDTRGEDKQCPACGYYLTTPVICTKCGWVPGPELIIDIETDGLLKGKKVLPFDGDREVILIGSNLGQVEGVMGRPEQD